MAEMFYYKEQIDEIGSNKIERRFFEHVSKEKALSEIFHSTVLICKVSIMNPIQIMLTTMNRQYSRIYEWEIVL